MDEHPSPEKLRRFVAGELSQVEARKVMAHVREGCRRCGEDAVHWNLLRLGRASRPACAEATPSPAPASWLARSRM